MPWKGSLHFMELNTILDERCILYLLLAPLGIEFLGYRPVRESANTGGHILCPKRTELHPFA